MPMVKGGAALEGVLAILCTPGPREGELSSETDEACRILSCETDDTVC
jgi:hypothetical protein